MAKKYYAVRVGKVPGIYQTWDECKKNVHGFPAAEYKSFMSMEEAKAYMGREAVQEINGKTGSGNMEDVMPDNDYAFVDGSFNIATGVYGYGGFLMHDGVRYELSGNGSDKEMASMRNVAGEILGSMAAVKKAIELGLKAVSYTHLRAHESLDLKIFLYSMIMQVSRHGLWENGNETKKEQ